MSFDGGKSRNAIPRDAIAVVLGHIHGQEAAFRTAIDVASSDDPRRLLEDGPWRYRSRSDAPRAPRKPWTAEATKRLLDVVATVPTGPLAMSPDFAGLVETRTSLGEAATEGDDAHPAQPLALLERLSDA